MPPPVRSDREQGDAGLTRYSLKPLAERLGLRPNQRLYFEGAPLLYLDALGPSPSNVRYLDSPVGPIDFIHLFAGSRDVLVERMPLLARQMSPRGMLWVSWPKRQGASADDLDRDAVREIGAACGLSAVKTCDIDDRWSGHKFVKPRKKRLRPASSAGPLETQPALPEAEAEAMLVPGASY